MKSALNSRKTYIIFGVFNAAMTIHVFLMFPETKGRSLEEIDAVFTSGIPPWKLHTAASETKIAQTIQRTREQNQVYSADEEKEKEAVTEVA